MNLTRNAALVAGSVAGLGSAKSHRVALIAGTASVAAYKGEIRQVASSAARASVASMAVATAQWLDPRGGLALAASRSVPSRLTVTQACQQLVVSLERDYPNGETSRMGGAIRMAPQ